MRTLAEIVRSQYALKHNMESEMVISHMDIQEVKSHMRSLERLINPTPDQVKRHQALEWRLDELMEEEEKNREE